MQNADDSSTTVGWKRAVSPCRPSTTVRGLSKSHCRGEPPKNSCARMSERRSDEAPRSQTHSAYSIRDHDSTMTNIHNPRRPPGTSRSPTKAQST